MWSALHQSSPCSLHVTFEFPVLTTHGTQLVNLLRVQPLDNAVNVETMGAFSPDWKTSPKLSKRHHGKTFTVITKDTKHKESIGNCSFRFKYFTSLMIIHIGIDWLYIVYCSTFLLVKNLTILWGCQQIDYWYTPACKWFTARFFSIGAV